jgi:hypothetical protein
VLLQGLWHVSLLTLGGCVGCASRPNKPSCFFLCGAVKRGGVGRSSVHASSTRPRCTCNATMSSFMQQRESLRVTGVGCPHAMHCRDLLVKPATVQDQIFTFSWAKRLLLGPAAPFVTHRLLILRLESVINWSGTFRKSPRQLVCVLKL